jgi:hypothetical protein
MLPKDQISSDNLQMKSNVIEIVKICFDLWQLCSADENTCEVVLIMLDAHGACKSLRNKPNSITDPTRVIFSKLHDLVDHFR